MENVLKIEPEKRRMRRLSNEEANRLTKDCLQKALIFLMGKKSFDKITITELVKRSGVSRTSFYRNYKSKEDILADISRQFAQLIANLMKKAPYENDRYQWYYDIFRNVQIHQDTVRLLIQANLRQNTSFHIIPVMQELYEQPSSENHYKILAKLGALDAIVYNWFIKGRKESIEDMAQLCVKISL